MVETTGHLAFSKCPFLGDSARCLLPPTAAAEQVFPSHPTKRISPDGVLAPYRD
jgi:hypothetical protein